MRTLMYVYKCTNCTKTHPMCTLGKSRIKINSCDCKQSQTKWTNNYFLELPIISYTGKQIVSDLLLLLHVEWITFSKYCQVKYLHLYELQWWLKSVCLMGYSDNSDRLQLALQFLHNQIRCQRIAWGFLVLKKVCLLLSTTVYLGAELCAILFGSHSHRVFSFTAH